MRRSLPLLLLAIVSLCGGLLFAPAQAEVDATQQVKIRDESPESGRHKMRFRNYGERKSVGGGCTGGGVTSSGRCFYRVTKGRVLTKLSTYKLEEDRDFDYYLVDVDMIVKRKGSSHWGWLHAILTTKKGTKLVDTTETTSVSATEGDCRSVNLRLTTPWPVVSASADLGSVQFCSDEAHFNRYKRSARTSEYKANRMGKTNHLSLQRWVKVREGQQPRFRVRLELPNDKCTNYNDNSECTSFDNSGHAKTFNVGTKL